MNVTYVCPECDQVSRVELEGPRGPIDEVPCAHCGHRLAVPPGALADGRLERCVVCPSTDLYVRKDFSQRLGVAIVILGIVASSIAWFTYHVYATYAILFATALIDVVFYVLVGDLLQCYRCHAQYRGVAGLEGRDRFDLETHEKHRQQLARLSSPAGR